MTCIKDSVELYILKRSQASGNKEIHNGPHTEACQNENMQAEHSTERERGKGRETERESLCLGLPQEEQPNLLQEEHPNISRCIWGS